MVQRKPTPEEQLLKLIENPDAAKGTAASPETGKEKKSLAKKFGLPDFSKVFGVFAFARDKLTKKESAGKTKTAVVAFDIRAMNRVLFALLVATVIYLVADWFFLKPQQTDFLAQVGTSDPVYPTLSELPKADQTDLVSYEEPIGVRNPFLDPGVAAAQDPNALRAIPSSDTPKLTDALQGLKLVGIAAGIEPLAMVEDENTGRTYFLKRGQELRGVKIQTVSEEAVVVTYEGEQGQLF